MFEKPERRLSLQELGLKNKDSYGRKEKREFGRAGTNRKRLGREEANREGMSRGGKNHEGMNRAGMNTNREGKAKSGGSGWFESFLHNDNLLKLMVAGIVVSVGLIFWGKGGGPDTPVFKPVAQTLPAAKDNNAGGTQIGALEQALENRLADNLSQISGVGQVKVMVTLGTGLKSDYGQNASVTKSTTEETDKTGGTRKSTQTTETDNLVLPNGSTQPVIIMQESPNIEGVLVVAEGAKDPAVQEEIHTTVCTLLHIPAAKVVVEAMGGF
ncbi:Hypothetical protein DEACI_2806 [Acididesulfobacillus acetoxydans]|uniref:Stage III sporulation protein AG n=1 Tax=Acididesulfobacillus acetoxydans TaxID=1561005 RepID=A0A8S0WPS5_9FIRM|nr:hypothetical protein [Acididesulfobacillus acetoxydans]CAA7602134.1 Hypothetical protein DEACI_2806 [Acididesulfobacillus acetoxydans]CEJ08023.1 Hypothetical protein DEACI_2498 [Acididesulfobacillus acetoxydans]